MEELVSIGAVGLIKAVDTFDQEKASKLATYAARCVENEILMYLRVRKKISRESSYYEPSVQIRKEMRSDCWILWRARIRKRWM